MNFIAEKNRIYAMDSNNELVAEITFPHVSSDINSDIVDINHTFVDTSLRGQGVAGKLVEAAYYEIKRQGKKAVVSCAYAIKWFDEHEEYRDILQ